MTRHATIIATALLIAFATLNTRAQAQTVELVRIVPVGSTLDMSFVGSGRTIVMLTLTGDMQEIPVGCGPVLAGTRPLQSAVVINPGEQAIRTEFALKSGGSLPPGTRLGNATSDVLLCCIDENYNTVPCSSARFSIWLTTLDVVNPKNSSPMLFTSPATATADTIGVVTGQQDEDGFAKVVLTAKGQKSTFATLWTDQLLEPSDRIVDVIELDYDSETGIALYGGFLEY